MQLNATNNKVCFYQKKKSKAEDEKVKSKTEGQRLQTHFGLKWSQRRMKEANLTQAHKDSSPKTRLTWRSLTDEVETQF